MLLVYKGAQNEQTCVRMMYSIGAPPSEMQ
jgi:hypothetical protein